MLDYNAGLLPGNADYDAGNGLTMRAGAFVTIDPCDKVIPTSASMSAGLIIGMILSMINRVSCPYYKKLLSVVVIMDVSVIVR